MSSKRCDRSPPSPAIVTRRRRQIADLKRMIGQTAPEAAKTSVEGTPPLNRLIGGEPRPRRLVDLLGQGEGSGAGLIALWLCRRAAASRGEIVVIDSEKSFFPTAAIAWGIDARRLLVVTPTSPTEALISTEIALRSNAVGAVWARLDAINGRAYRRLLLAAETGSAFGALVRPAEYEADPSWAHAQLLIEPLAGGENAASPLRVRASQRRSRQGPVTGNATIAVDWRTGRIIDLIPPHDAPTIEDPSDALRLASRLADPKDPTPATRAAS